jgi:hypothetical protein
MTTTVWYFDDDNQIDEKNKHNNQPPKKAAWEILPFKLWRYTTLYYDDYFVTIRPPFNKPSQRGDSNWCIM